MLYRGSADVRPPEIPSDETLLRSVNEGQGSIPQSLERESQACPEGEVISPARVFPGSTASEAKKTIADQGEAVNELDLLCGHGRPSGNTPCPRRPF